jgi:hypothetical protein
MSSGWGCPNEVKGHCMKVGNSVGEVACDPGMKGCVLFGRFRFSNETKNKPEGLRTPQVPKPVSRPE